MEKKEEDCFIKDQGETLKHETKKIQIRLRRIEGQIKGIEKMILASNPCKDVLVQISAIASAINKVGTMIFENYATSCLKFYSEGDKKELVTAMMNFTKSKYIDNSCSYTFKEIIEKLQVEIKDVYKMLDCNSCSKELLTVITKLRINVNVLSYVVFENYTSKCSENLSNDNLEEIISTILMFIK